MAHGLYNCSVERIVAKLNSTSAQVKKSGIDKRVFINDEEIISFGYRNGILMLITKELKVLIYSQNEKLNLFILN